MLLENNTVIVDYQLTKYHYGISETESDHFSIDRTVATSRGAGAGVNDAVAEAVE